VQVVALSVRVEIRCTQIKGVRAAAVETGDARPDVLGAHHSLGTALLATVVFGDPASTKADGNAQERSYSNPHTKDRSVGRRAADPAGPQRRSADFRLLIRRSPVPGGTVRSLTSYQTARGELREVCTVTVSTLVPLLTSSDIRR